MFPFAGGRFGGKHCGPGGFGGHHGHGPFGHLADLLEDLDLTDDQVERIADLKSEGMSEGMRMMSEGGQSFKTLIRELMKEDLNKDKAREAHKKLQEQKIKMGEAMFERALTFAETLTPEQRKKLRRSIQRRFLGLDGGHRGGPGFGPGFGFGPGPGGPGGRHER